MTSWDGVGSGGSNRSSQPIPAPRKDSPSRATSHLRSSSPAQRVTSVSYIQAGGGPRNRAGDEVPAHHRHYHHRHGDHVVDDRGHGSRDIPEDVKGYCENLLRDKDEIIRKLEKKGEYLQREVACIRHTKDKEIESLRQNVECNVRVTEDVYEKRLHETIAEAEKQKAVLQREHTKRVQELLDSTNKRLQEMEESYGDRISYLTGMVDELECKLTTLSKDMEESVTLKACLKDEKKQLENDLCCIQEQNEVLKRQLKETMRDLEVTKDRLHQLEMGKATLEEMHQTTLDDTRKRLECEIHSLKERNDENELQFKCQIATLQQGIESFEENKKQFEDMHSQRMKELESRHITNVQQVEEERKREAQQHQDELEGIRAEYDSRNKALEVAIHEKDQQVNQLLNHKQAILKDYEEKFMQEKEVILQYEKEMAEKESKLKALCDQVNALQIEKEFQVNDLRHRLEAEKCMRMEEVRELTKSLHEARCQRELQMEDAARLLEEEKRHCAEKVSKESEQLKQSICLCKKEVHDLTTLLTEERNLYRQEIRDYAEKLEQAKQLNQEQAEKFLCKLEEAKLVFHKQIQELSKQVDQHRANLENQRLDAARLADNERKIYEEQLEQLIRRHQVDVGELVNSHKKEMEAAKRDPQNYTMCLEEKFTKLLTEAEDRAWEQEQCFRKRISELERQIQLYQLQAGDITQRTLASYDAIGGRRPSADMSECQPGPSHQHNMN